MRHMHLHMGMRVQPAVPLHASAGKGRSGRERSGGDFLLHDTHCDLEIVLKYLDFLVDRPIPVSSKFNSGTEASKCWNSKVTRKCFLELAAWLLSLFFIEYTKCSTICIFTR